MRVRSRVIAVSAGLALGFFGGTAGMALASSGAAESEVRPVPEAPSNGDGLTYGSAAAASTSDDEPDLILVVTTEGKTAYVHKSDLDAASGAMVQTREEAIKWSEVDGRADRTITAYENDGITPAGQFLVQGLDSQEQALKDR